MAAPASGDNSNFVSDWRVCPHQRAICPSRELQLVGMGQQQSFEHLVYKRARFIYQFFHG
jgi:hypothetical protein